MLSQKINKVQKIVFSQKPIKTTKNKLYTTTIFLSLRKN